MNLTSTGHDDHLDLHDGLSVEVAVRIAEALQASHADYTRAVYDYAWSRCERWCTARDVDALPAQPPLICAHLTESAAAGLSVGSIDLACSALSCRHYRSGHPDPILDEGVRQVRRGLRRLVGAAPQRQARPFGTDGIRQIVEHIDRTRPVGIRDTAIILLGLASAMRRSEIVALALADVEFQPGGSGPHRSSFQDRPVRRRTDDRCRSRRSPSCSAATPKPPATPRTGSPPRPDTNDSPPSLRATSDLLKHWSTPPVETWDCK
ncbi:hypothetical protein [Nocardioides daejeonensis]|uniref:hypothetical protein n=1 Tax=Nocardioides daejeonensis TaxID=1046556 RepID=UPI0013A54B00|nr:hypothetical protein [Nocardioides daejeonensis]